jgi:hypothetical protein
MPDGSRRQKVGGVWVPIATGQDPVRAAPKLAAREQIQLSEARTAAEGSREAAITAQRFVTQKENAPTGGFLRQIPLAIETEAVWNPQVSTMNALSAKMAPQQRQPGSGSTSDKDLSLYLTSTPSAKKTGAVNSEIARQAREDASRRSQYAQFLDRWAMERGTLNGAEEAWQASGGALPGGPAARPAKPKIASQAAMATQQRMEKAGTLKLARPRGDPNNPYIAKDKATLDRLPKGSWAIGPDGVYGQVE